MCAYDSIHVFVPIVGVIRDLYVTSLYMASFRSIFRKLVVCKLPCMCDIV